MASVVKWPSILPAPMGNHLLESIVMKALAVILAASALFLAWRLHVAKAELEWLETQALLAEFEKDYEQEYCYCEYACNSVPCISS